MSNEAVISHVHRDDEGSKMGMWLFLFTELLLFGRHVYSVCIIQIYVSGYF